ncbi:WD40 repeat protein [Jejuia pallidilutea]|jgi:outer membrane protein OmpA-like peptidoglycan-associated protein|uniref:WD40 repeat protein n=1 Tax=Jejuia pallidilutea TaxID=504487 RepID=A0A362WZN3_9FLAO|nr:OmpA family protein [Jejuia pallidilutea]PQV48418.1 WD40 repeat protein [Jejuia pallidilutea]
MKKTILYCFYFFSSLIFSQATANLAFVNSLDEVNDIIKERKPSNFEFKNNSGYNFEILDAGINSKYSEICSGAFRNKIIMVSSKKLGAFAKIDPYTGEGYKDLYCVDVSKNGQLRTPLLFSRILNTKYNEGQLSFTPDQKTVYYTRSTKDISYEYKLYKAVLEEDSHGNWVNETLLSVNKENVSIENPYVNSTGDKLYFSANMPNSYGGFDLYVCDIKSDGELSVPVNLGSNINTSEDEKYPSLSKDSKYLYFSSRGHLNFGGYDVFESKILKTGYTKPRNMGNTLNTKYDEIAFVLIVKNKGYVSSNRRYGSGYNLYTAINDEVEQKIKGRIIDSNSQAILAGSVITLLDEEGTEISRDTTGIDANYSFKVRPFESYKISVSKEGFKSIDLDFLANRGNETTYLRNIELIPDVSKEYDVERELRLLADNIFFDSNKSNIKRELHRVLNKVIYILNEHPKMQLAIDAHTDNVGSDSFNLSLSEDRAASVLNYLIENGIPKDRLRSKGYGETKPIINCKDNCSEEDLQTNRRVELVIINKRKL